MRCMDTSDLGDLLEQLDEALWHVATVYRASTSAGPFDKQLIKLPVKFGGLGLLSHKDIAPLARAASNEAADVALSPLLDLPESAPVEPVRQGIRTKALVQDQHAALVSRLSAQQRCLLAEGSSIVGRKWLSVFPTSSSLKLTDKEVSTALHARTLCHGTDSHCLLCGLQNHPLHEEICRKMENVRLARHERLKKLFLGVLGSLPRTTVVSEPAARQLPGRAADHCRTDFRVKGPPAQGGQQEYDLTIVSFASQDSQAACSRVINDQAIGATASPEALAQAALSVAARKKVTKYFGRTETPFAPLVFSTGGVVEDGTLDVLMHWRDALGPYGYNLLMCRVCILLQRARNFTFRI